MTFTVIIKYGFLRRKDVFVVVGSSALLVEQRLREDLFPEGTRPPKSMTIYQGYRVDFSKPIPLVA